MGERNCFPAYVFNISTKSNVNKSKAWLRWYGEKSMAADGGYCYFTLFL